MKNSKKLADYLGDKLNIISNENKTILFNKNYNFAIIIYFKFMINFIHKKWRILFWLSV